VKNIPKKLIQLCAPFALLLLMGFRHSPTIPQTDPGGVAVNYNNSHEMPQSARPNDATISLYEENKSLFLLRRDRQDMLYTINPKGNSVDFLMDENKPSIILEKELAEGYILSYLYYEKGRIKYNGKAKDGRFKNKITDETIFFTHSTGKSITSYIVGHAICDGYIGSMDEIIDWPMMSQTLYQGQPLRNLLNMNAGDKHTVDKESTRVMGSATHHRNMGLDTIAVALKGTKKQGSDVFYNNFLSDVIANYIAFKAGDDYDKLMFKVFQDKVKIQNKVTYERHGMSLTEGSSSIYYGKAETRASYSYQMSRFDFLRVAEAIMKDYQDQTCVGQYLKQAQSQAKNWPNYGPNRGFDSKFNFNNYAKKYGAQFYFDFYGMSGRNIFATEGLNSQNMMIDMDNSRIVVTNSAARAWDQRVFMLNVIEDGELPK
jgi:CubicO group peptidase (beta-lactamase class C family)